MTKTLVCTGHGSSALESPLQFGLARNRQDLTSAFQLVFDSYFNAGLVDEKRSGLRLTPHHLLPTSEVLIAKLGDTVTSTLSMFGDGYLGLPMESMYPLEVKTLRDQGLRLAEIGCLADRRNSQTRFIETFAHLGRLLAQIAVARGIDGILAATHPRHAKLYKRIMGFRQIGQLAECPYANGNPAVALFLKFNEHRGTSLYSQYFDEPLEPATLEPYRWDRNTRQHFREILESDSQSSCGQQIQGYYNWAAVTGNLTF